jgi:hypothetical protein
MQAMLQLKTETFLIDDKLSLNMDNSKCIRTADFFAEVGGIRLGFEKAGFKTGHN